MIKRSHDWPEETATGARWLFWTLALSAPATFLSGLVLPFLGGTSRDLKFVDLIPGIAAFPLLVGLVKLVARRPRRARNSIAWLRNALLAVGCMECLCRVTQVILDFMTSKGDFPLFDIGRFGVNLFGPVMLFAYVGAVARRFERGYFPRAAVAVGFLLATVPLGFQFGAELSQSIGMPSWSRYTIQSLLVEAGAGAVTGVFGLAVLWRFSRRLPTLARGKCWECGYDLRGQVDARCPECGREFTLRDPGIEGTHPVNGGG